MENEKFDFEREIVPAVMRRAQLVFRLRANQEELLSDALSLAWEAVQTAPLTVSPRSVAYYSCLRALHGRQFRTTQRSLGGTNLKHAAKPLQDPDAQVGLLPSGKRDNPAELAAVRVDFGGWLETLSTREKEFLLGFLYGESTQSLAQRMHCTSGRVSQMRRILVESWLLFTS